MWRGFKGGGIEPAFFPPGGAGVIDIGVWALFGVIVGVEAISIASELLKPW